MKLILKFFFGLLIFSQLAVAESTPGYDVLGLAKYCDRYLQAPRLPQVSTLLRSFGDPLPCIDRDLARGGKEKVQYNLRDATCWRNKKCPAGTPSLTDWNDIKRLALSVNKIAVKYPNVDHEISPYLEHDFKDAKIIQKACSVALSACPTCTCINEPFSGTKNTGYPLELHGTKVTAWSVSGDGASMFDGDNIKNDGNNFQHRISGSDSTYAWIPEFNGRTTGEKTFTPINKRSCWPDSLHFKHIHRIMVSEEDSIPSPPAQCKSVVRIDGKKGEINKTNAEAYSPCPDPDKRGNKQLLILRKGGKRGDRIKIYSKNGKEVGCFAYYGTFTTPGTHRWYIGNCSGERPYQLFEELGNEWGFAEVERGKCLLFNSLRREGSHR